MTIAERIRGWREYAGLKQTELANECEVSDQSVYLWEAGRTEPTHDNVQKIAAACGVSLPMFWGDPPRKRAS